MTSNEAEVSKIDSKGRRVVVDPVCRIEGHLRIEVNLDNSNVIRNAVSTGTMWRGLEVILQGRDPRDAWAFAQRICGVCTGPHALASVRSVEDALSIKIPENANTIRNIMHLNLFVHDHLVHFYHLHSLDWVDVISALKADPKATSEAAQRQSSWPMSSPGYFNDVQTRLKKFIESGQLGLFSNAYWGNPAYKLPPEINLLAVAHYLEALDFQKEIIKVHTIFGGKNPHPNWLVGGVPCPINLEGAGGAINIERLNMIKTIIDRSAEFVEKVYLPDLLTIASYYKDWLHGGGIASKNLMAYGEIPIRANDYTAGNFQFPRGAIINGNLAEIHDIDLYDPSQIQEFVTHSWYKYPTENVGLHPFDGITNPDFTLGPNTVGTKTKVENFDESAKYSWIKAPRWKGHPMEVGPLARIVLGYMQPKQFPFYKESVDSVLNKLDLPFEALFSTLGRTAARGIETLYCAKLQQEQFDKLMSNIKAGDINTANTEKWYPSSWPTEARGVGFSEAPRGALGHWLKIKDTKIENYQCVVPTTWNASPRDHQGQIGAYEAALLNTPVANPEQPLEILRTLHSFDPCLACATHIIDPNGAEMSVVKIL